MSALKYWYLIYCILQYNVGKVSNKTPVEGGGDYRDQEDAGSGVYKGGYWGYLPPPRILGVNTPP